MEDNIHDQNEPIFAAEIFISNLLKESVEDKNAAFRPESLRILAYLQDADAFVYEKLRDDLRDMKVVVSRLDSAVTAYRKNMKANTGVTKNKNQTNDLIELASIADYFHDVDGIAYADITAEDGHRETWAVTSEGYKRWLRGVCYKKTKGAISSDVFNTAIQTLAARAQNDGEERPVCIRAGRHDGKIYIDLCNEKWQAIEISTEGYKVIDNPPLRFRRRKGMKPLPLPVSGGTIFDLRPFVNVPTDRGFVLIVAWLLMALSGQGPYPVLIVVGEQGTSKSTLMALLRQLVDPNSAPLRTLPKEVRDLFIAANSAWVLAFDNLSNMKDWISDALCRLATGGGFATRALFTNEEEMLFDAMRPIMMNGIENVAPRGDLIDRAIVLMLEPISEERRQPVNEIQVKFDSICPRVLGALLDMMVYGLKKLPDIKLERQPRMADFAIWISACETAVWPSGTFMEAYEANRVEANEDIIAASVLATTVYEFMKDKKQPWEDTATNLLSVLKELVPDDHITNDKRLWPSTGRVLSERLRRVASALRKTGVEVEYLRGHDSVRHIKLTYTKCEKPATSPTSTPLTVSPEDTEIIDEILAGKNTKPSKLTKRGGGVGKSQGRRGRRNTGD